jgi:hypothetical protein
MDPNVVNVSIDCEYASDSAPNVTGIWSSWTYDCTASLCLDSVVQRYLEMWGNLSSYNPDAYASVRDSAWPELGQYAVTPGQAVSVRLGSAGYIGVTSGQLALTNTSVAWTVLYPGFDSNPTPWMLEGSAVQLVTAERGILYCLASSRMAAILQLQLYGTVQLPLAASAIFSVSAPICGAYRLDTPVLRDELGTSYMSSSLRWITSGTAPAMTVTSL